MNVTSDWSPMYAGFSPYGAPALRCGHAAWATACFVYASGGG